MGIEKPMEDTPGRGTRKIGKNGKGKMRVEALIRAAGLHSGHANLLMMRMCCLNLLPCVSVFPTPSDPSGDDGYYGKHRSSQSY